MNKVAILFFYGFVLLTACNKQPNSENVSGVNDSLKGSSVSNDQTLKLDTGSTRSHHSIIYSDSLKIHYKKILADTSSETINCKGDIVAYRINYITKEVMRICAAKTDRKDIKQLLINNRQFQWDKRNGFPNEFIGDFVFSDIYNGGDLGGTILKHKFQINKNELIYLDSIPGGSYSEGAGTWEWLISDDAKKKVIIFHGGDTWTHRENKLLISPEGSKTTYLIDLQETDTILAFNRPGIDVYSPGQVGCLTFVW